MTKVTTSTVFFHSLRMWLYYKLCKFVKDRAFKQGGKITMPKLLTLLALLGGTVVYHILSNFLDWLMCKIFKLHSLGPFDNVFFFPKRDEDSNVGAYMKFEKFDPYKMKQYWLENIIDKMPTKFNCKLIEIFGKNYWIEMSEEEFRSRWDEIFIIDKGVNSKEQLEKKLLEIMDYELPLYENVPYRFYTYHDYDENCSMLLILFNHAWVDGVQIISMINYMSENPNIPPPLPSLTFYQQILSVLMVPIVVAYLGLKCSLLIPNENSCIKKDSGHQKLNRVVKISNEFNFIDMRKQCKVYKCSVNEALRAILGITIKEYALKNNDPNLEWIRIVQTNSLGNFPQKGKDLVLGNNWVGQYINIPVNESLKECIQINKELSAQHRQSIVLLGMKYFIGLLNLLPFNLAIYPMEICTQKLTMIFTGVPGPKESWKLAGKKVLSASACTPNQRQLITGIASCSLGTQIHSCFITDLHYIQNPDQFMNIYNRQFQKFIYPNGMPQQEVPQIKSENTNEAKSIKAAKL